MQDKWGVLVYGWGLYIRLDDWDVRLFDLFDFLEIVKDDDNEEGSVDIEKGKLMFFCMVLFIQIVFQIFDNFFIFKVV